MPGEYRPVYNGRPVYVNQLTHEILSLMEQLKAFPPKRILEIGTFCGGTLYMWTTVAKEEATIITVDLPNGYPDSQIAQMIEYGQPKKQHIFLIRGNSHSVDTMDRIDDILQGEPLDFLFIDGDHSYESVKQDFEMYSPFVRKGGIIGFHDIMPLFGVAIFWNEIKVKYKYTEIIENPNQAGYGIGLLFV